MRLIKHLDRQLISQLSVSKVFIQCERETLNKLGWQKKESNKKKIHL